MHAGKYANARAPCLRTLSEDFVSSFSINAYRSINLPSFFYKSKSLCSEEVLRADRLEGIVGLSLWYERNLLLSRDQFPANR